MGVTKHSFRSSRRRRSYRAGYLYIAVVFTTLILVTIVATAINVSTLRTKTEVSPWMRSAVLRAAESEIHRIAVTMRDNASWRWSNQNNVFSTWRASGNTSVFGEVLVRHRYLDVDGDLTDSLEDAVELQVHAKNMDAETAISVNLVSDPQPYEFLQNSTTTLGDLEVNSQAMITCGSAVHVGDDFQGSNSGVLATRLLKVVGSVSAPVRGDVESGDNVSLVNLVPRFVLAGEVMDTNMIPMVGGKLRIEDELISPANNPFGAVSPDGIYVINAGGAPVRISNCRIVATLVIQQAASVQVRKGIVWECPVEGGALLVTTAPVELMNIDATLDESLHGVNFNPSTTPYRDNQSNATTLDLYPQTLRGWIHTTDDFVVNQPADKPLNVLGGIYADKMTVTGRLRIQSYRELRTNPSSLLRWMVPMQFDRGTWRRIETP